MSEFKVIDESQEWAEFRKSKGYHEGIIFRNMKEFPVERRPLRGTGGVHFELADNKTMAAHVSEIPPLGSSKRHRHQNEAIIYIVCGKGYSLIQVPGEEEHKYEWQEGDLFSPPFNAWHQHFNVDPEKPARYLAITNTIYMRWLGAWTKEQWTGEK